MTDEEKRQLRALLHDRLVLALGVLVDGAPYLGQLPFALGPTGDTLIVQASRLARHTRGLTDGAPFSALIQSAVAEHDDPFQLPRLMLDGVVRVLPRSHADYDRARECYTAKLPTGQPLFELGDFGLYELVIKRGRLVSGFARARNVSPGQLRDA